MKRSRPRAMISRVARGERQQRLVHGRHGGVPGRRTSSNQAKKRKALKPGVQHTAAPAASDDSVAAIRPWMWNSGMMLRQTSSGVSARSSAIW